MDDFAEILDNVQEFATRFIAYPTPEAAPVHALWIAHTHLVDAFENTPRLAFLSPEPGSGKSRAMEITEALVPRPVLSVNASVAYVFRKISDPNGLPTLLMDEADAVFSHKKADGNEDLRGLLNSGYRRGATAGRVVMRGNEQIPEDWPSFCPVALAGLNELPDTLMSRSIIVPMKKRRPDQVVQPYRRRIYGPEAAELSARLQRAARRHFDELRVAFPKLPPGIEDRNADIWEPLVAVADAAGGHWSQTAREAATQLVATAGSKPQTLGVKLLADLREVFGDRESMLTRDLLDELLRIDASPWGSMKGVPIDARFLARTLGKYEVSTNQSVRTSTGPGKGYKRADLFDAWERYLPPLSPKVGDVGDIGDATGQSVTDVTDCTSSPSSLESDDGRHVTDVTDVTESWSNQQGACPHGLPEGKCFQCRVEGQDAA